MNFFSRLTDLFRSGSAMVGGKGGGKGDSKSEPKSDLQKNMEKALEMKQAAGPQANIPEHQTSHDGMRPQSTNDTDRSLDREANFTPQLKRSGVARSGDAS